MVVATPPRPLVELYPSGPRWAHKPTRAEREHRDFVRELAEAKRKASQQLRLCLICNDNFKLQKVLMIDPPSSLLEFLKLASRKFARKGRLAFRRVFTEEGEELKGDEALPRLFEERSVVLSAGEEFCSAAPPTPVVPSDGSLHATSRPRA